MSNTPTRTAVAGNGWIVAHPNRVLGTPKVNPVWIRKIYLPNSSQLLMTTPPRGGSTGTLDERAAFLSLESDSKAHLNA